MNTTIDDGGPAFPHEGFKANYEIGKGPIKIPHTFPGMTLRDIFAGQALIGLVPMSQRLPDILPDDKVAPAIANAAYDMADAMIAARNQQTKS